METDNPFNIMIAHIRQRNIVPLKKGKPGIIILKIQRIPHPPGHLVDKAEHTLVAAGPVLIPQPLFELYPQIFFSILFYLKLPFLPVGLTDQNRQILVIYIEMIVKYILYLVAVDGDQDISRLNLQLLRNASRADVFYNMFVLHIGILSFLNVYFNAFFNMCREKLPRYILLRIYLTLYH